MRLIPILVTAALLAGCSSAGSNDLHVGAVPTSVTVSIATFDGVGAVLSSGGRPLYVFSPDHHAAVTCTGACTGTWPPLLTSGSAAGVGGLATVAAPDAPGARIVTFDGWPLYFYAGDGGGSMAHGQSLFLNGGPWYVIRADGTIVTTKLVDGS